MLDLEVIPEYGLRGDHIEFILGTPINQVIAFLQDNCRVVDKVEIAYSKAASFVYIYFLFFYLSWEI